MSAAQPLNLNVLLAWKALQAYATQTRLGLNPRHRHRLPAGRAFKKMYHFVSPKLTKWVNRRIPTMSEKQLTSCMETLKKLYHNYLRAADAFWARWRYLRQKNGHSPDLSVSLGTGFEPVDGLDENSDVEDSSSDNEDSSSDDESEDWSYDEEDY
jgi:hypothetical protein